MHNDLGILVVKQEISNYSKRYIRWLSERENTLTLDLSHIDISTYRLKKYTSLNLVDNF